METTSTYNSVEFIKSQIYRPQDGSSAHMHSEDTVDHLPIGFKRDEAWNEAIAVASEILEREGLRFSHIEDNGNFVTAYWTK